MIVAALRSILGFALVLFIPGYAATWALFPDDNEIDFIERIALSFGLSISLVVLTIFVINYALKVPINLVSSILVVLFITLSCSGVYYFRAGGREEAKPAKSEAADKKPAEENPNKEKEKPSEHKKTVHRKHQRKKTHTK